MLKKLTLILIGISILFNINVKAEELPTFKVGSCTAYKGETITVPIYLENNPGFDFLGIKIRYNSEKLEYVESYLTAEFTGASLKGIEINAKKTITLYALTSEDEKAIDVQGKIAEIKFKVLADNFEDVPIEATIDNFGKGRNEKIDITKIDGNVHILVHGVIGEKENLSSELDELLEKNNIDNKNIKWRSSNEDVATVDEEGSVTFKDNGTAKIEATDEDGNVLYEKSYKVDKKNTTKTSDTTKVNYFVIFLIILLILIILIISFLIVRKRLKKK